MSESEDPRELARRLVEEAKQRAAKPAAKPAPKPAVKRSFADRAPKPVSAKDAMQAAIEAEAREAQAAEKADAARKLVEQAKKRLAAQAPAAEAAPAPVVAAPAPVAPAAPTALAAPDAVLSKRLPGYTISRILPIEARSVLIAMWTANRVRAAAEGDLAMIITADVLIDAAKRLPPGALHAAEIHDDQGSHAVFIDAAGSALIGVASPPELYLAGL